MDYANGTELWKYQRDLIHNPETILLGAYNEEEGAMTDDVFWINYFSRNITIHPDYTIGNDNLNYITPAGKPFVLPMSASVSFSGSFTNKSTNSTEQVAMPRGVLYAFADETGTYYANLTKKNGGQYYFNGYKKAKADGVFKESEVGGGSTHKVVVGIENESCRLFISGANYSFDQVALTKYRGDGPVLTVDALPVELTGHIAANISIPSGKCFPDVWYAIDPLSLDEFENGTYAKYNPYGNDYGLLVKLKDGRFVYSRVVSGGTTEYHVWNGKEWVQTMAPKAGCLSCELSELLTLWSFVQLAKEEGHTALDFVGTIPIAGELADGVNGIWYLVEGDRVNAGFSFASMLPLIGDAGVKGAKYAFKVGKDLKVVAGAAEAFSAIHKALKAKEAGLLVLCMDRSALLMGRHANHVETIRSLCVSVPDVGELEKVLKKLHDMAPEDCAKFLDDLATSDLSKNLEKVNVGLVESWKRFGNSPLRTNTKYLDAIADFPPTWKIETSGEVTKIMNGSGHELAELTDDLVKVKGGSKGSWNELLNKPPIKSHKYQVDKYLYETDELGRVNKVKGELEFIERGRNEYQQALSVDLKDGVKGQDDGGHLIANILNGPGEQLNYLPQTVGLNRGKWKTMETAWVDALKAGKKVEVEIVPVFSGSSKRPVKFEVEYWIDGKYKFLEFDN
ncbi:MAG: DNA/RNA non-specific endonuclease [Breznakibacter sp.]